MFVLKKIREYASDPERVALIDRDRRMTYAELDARSEAFAAWLLDHAASDHPVVICGDKEMDFLPCLFGVLKFRPGLCPHRQRGPRGPGGPDPRRMWRRR